MERTETNNMDDKGVDELMQPEERKKLIKHKFFEYSRKGDYYGLLKIIDDEMLNIEELDEKKWSGLQWAVVNGNLEVIKLLLEKLEENHQNNRDANLIAEKLFKKVEEVKDYKKNEFDDIFKKPPNSNQNGKYNPLHWAAYKGNIQITSVLLKYGYDPLDIDNVGNTSIHQAAASNNSELFKIFMGLGIDLEIKNDRGHMAIDLTADKTIKNIIQNALQFKNCQLCPKQFDFFNKRFLCSIGEEVICKNCCHSDYYYDNINSKDKDIYEARCKNCHNLILEYENNLRSAIKSNNLDDIVNVHNQIKLNKVKIDCKLSYDAECNIDRLEREKKIFQHLNGLKEVDNHKTIEKSVYLLEEMIKDARENKIDLDVNVIEKSFQEKNRLLAEKELRKVLSNLTVELSSVDNLNNLVEKIQNGDGNHVDKKFVTEAEELRKKIQLNLQAKDLLELFVEYPLREYPKPEIIDPKNRNKKEPPKPVVNKKKKKDPPFLVPEWAKELKILIEKAQELKSYLNMSAEIGLDEHFLARAKENLARINQEIPFRRNEEEALRKLEEDKKKKKR